METELITFLVQFANPYVGFFAVLAVEAIKAVIIDLNPWVKRILPFGAAIGLCYLCNFLHGLGSFFAQIPFIAHPIICGSATGWLASLGYKFVLKRNNPN